MLWYWRTGLTLMLACLSCSAAYAQHAVVVCPLPMQQSLTPWIGHRQSEGLRCSVIGPQVTASDTAKAIRQAATDQTRFVVIVGDAPRIGTIADVSTQTPMHYVPTTVTAKWHSTATLATDLPYGDFDGDGLADASVGRLPVDTAGQLSEALAKIILYEKRADFSRWRNRVHLVGGVGGFGLLIDSALETATRSVITGVLPSHVRTGVRFASPGHVFFPTTQSFTQTVLRDFSGGCRFWVYAGHGQVTELDRVPQSADGIAVLDADSVTKLSADGYRLPIALLLACYTGAVDAAADCIAEQMWLQPGGPIAVVAGSRVTMPYGNMSAALGLIDAVYQRQSSRLGDAWLHSVQALQTSLPQPPASDRRVPGPPVDTNDDEQHLSPEWLIDGLAAAISPTGSDLNAERREHAMLYNLIGDPTLRLVHPKEVSLDIQPGYDRLHPIDVKLASAISGTMTVTLHRPLGWDTEGDPNEKTIMSVSFPVVANRPVQKQVRPPAGVTGPVVVRVHVAGGNAWAAVAARTRIR